MSRPFARIVGMGWTWRSGGRRASALRLALDAALRAVIDAQVLPPEVEQRVRLGVDLERIHAADEQLVIPHRERLDDGALERRQGRLEERQAGGTRVPVRPAELVATRADRRMRKAVGDRLLVVAKDVDGEPP